MRLWVRLAMALVVLAVVPVLLVGLSAMEIATRRAEIASVERLRREAVLQAELIGQWVHDQAPLVVAFPQLYPGGLQNLSPEAQAKFPVMVYRLVSSAVMVVLVDGDGVLVTAPVYGRDPAGSTDEARAQQLISRLPLAAAVAEPGRVHLGPAWLPGGPGSWPSLPLAVLASSGATPGEQRILGVELGLDVIGDYLSTAREDHAVALLDAEGGSLFGGGHPLIDPVRLGPLLDTEQMLDFRLDTGPGEVRGSLVPVPNTPGWTMVIAEPADVVLAPASEIRDRMLIQFLIAVACAVVVAVLLASSLSRPVELLRDVVLEVSRGKYGVRAEIRRSDEIGELAQAFDHLSTRLEANRSEIAAQQEEIEAFNRQLQERVDARTRELRDAQEELVRSGQLAAVAELGAGLAHELNNPLAAVLGLAQLLRTRHPGDQMLIDLESQADRCREVVATMLRVQALEVDPSDAPVVALADVLHQVLELVGGPFRQRGVHLELSEVGSGLRVRMDPVHGSRILAQILNALRAGLEPGSAVQVGAERRGDEVWVRLSPDRPVGSHHERRDDRMASGHGLWVARQLLDRLGGRLDEGPGAEWQVVLPGASTDS